jgi:serine phosphatase RsbU (regulator of sigma subunit)
LDQTELARLVADPDLGARLADLTGRAAAMGSGVSIAILDTNGTALLVAGDGTPPDASSAIRPIRTGDAEAGRVAVSGPASAPLDAIAGIVAGAVGLTLASAAADRQAHDHRLEGELAIGRRIQRSLMPRRFPSLPGWEIAAAYDAAREVGGDLYDAFLLRDRPGCLGVVIADVTGKGIPAALVMADVRALLHAAADHGGGPALTIDRVNRILVGERATGLFVTVAHGELDAATGSLTLVSAGHEPVHVIRDDGALDVLEPPGCLVGMVAEIRVSPVDAVLEAGDALVLHTDGITEARNPEGGFYGDERFEALLGSLAGQAAADVVDAVLADVAAFRAGAEASDDLTLLVVRRSQSRTGAGAEADREGSAVIELGGEADVVVDVVTG